MLLRLLGTPLADAANPPIAEPPPRRLFALVALLVLSHNNTADRAAISSMLWEGSDTKRAQASLRHLLAQTRRWQASQNVVALDITNERLARGPSCVRSDLEPLLAMAEIDSPEAMSALTELYRGDLLSGFPEIGPQFDGWLSSQRDRVRERFVSLAVAGAERIGGAAGLTAMRTVMLQSPFDERVVRALMRILSRQGDTSAALSEFEALQLRLREELGTRPEIETLSLAQRLAASIPMMGEPTLAAASSGTPASPGSRGDAAVTFQSGVPRLMILLPEEARSAAGAQTRLLARALIEDVTTNLCRLQALAVIAPHTAARVNLVDARTAALQHRIDYVVESRLRRSGAEPQQVEIKLLHVETAELLWTETFGFSDLRRPQVLQDLAHWLAAIVASAVERNEMRSLAGNGPLAAYRHFLMGRHSLRIINLESIRRARKWFQQAAHLNPNFAAAQSWLAHCAILEWMVFSHSGPDLLHRASEAAQLAIDIDPTDGNGHRELGRAALFLGKLDESLEKFHDAERFAPHHADLLADYADTLMHNSKPAAAKQRIEQALSLNPLAPDVYYWIAGGITFFCGDPSAALGLLKKMRKPDQAFKLMAASAALAGDHVEAELYRKRALSNDPDFDLRTWALRLPQRERVHLDMYVEALRAAGFV